MLAKLEIFKDILESMHDNDSNNNYNNNKYKIIGEHTPAASLTLTYGASPWRGSAGPLKPRRDSSTHTSVCQPVCAVQIK